MQIFLQVLALSLVILLCVVESDSKDCHNPSRKVMRKLIRGLNKYKINELSQSFYLLDSLREKMSPIPTKYINRLYVKLDNESTECPQQLTQNMDLCPGYKVMDFDKFRIPSMLLQVHCKCQSCVGIDDHSTHCERMYYYRRVLRVTACDEEGVYVYNYHWERVSNGCVCKKNADAPQLPE
jgi:hypothetical protein